jgi:hypothetical protein
MNYFSQKILLYISALGVALEEAGGGSNLAFVWPIRYLTP